MASLLRKDYLAKALDGVGLVSLGLQARAMTGWPGRGLTVLLYHRVNDPARIGDLDPTLIDATPAAFDQQMALVRRYFAPVTLADALAARADPVGHPLPRNPILVTFDDGYRDNLEIATPILQAHGIRATFFIATGYLNNRRLFWWERVSLIMRRTTVPVFTIQYPAPYSIELGSTARREQATRHLLRTIKDHYDLDLDRFLAEIAAAAQITWTREEDERYCNQAQLTWDGVRALIDAGMDVASHTCEHRILQTLRADQLAVELAESKSDLEKHLGRPVRAVAYPVGKRIIAFPLVREAIQRAGYDLGFVVKSGINDFSAMSRASASAMSASATSASATSASATSASATSQTNHNGVHDPYDLKRIPVDRSWSMAQFRATLLYHGFAG